MNQSVFFIPFRSPWLQVSWTAGSPPGALFLVRCECPAPGIPCMAAGTLNAMDRVRFGRALGYGARHLGRTVVQAVDAAGAAPAQTPNARTAEPRPTPPSAAASAARHVASRAGTAKASIPQTKAQAAHLGRSVWKPLARFSSVVWLEVTGTFFAVIALFVGSGAWKLRGAIHQPVSSPAAHKLYLYVIVLVLFTYFAVSSFVRAHRRGRI